MVRKDRCCAGMCNNDRRYPDKLELVEKLNRAPVYVELVVF